MLPSDDDPIDEAETSGRPLDLLRASAWFFLVALTTPIVITMLIAAAPSTRGDLVSLVGAQALVYLTALYAIARIHAPNRRLRDVFALRATHPVMVVLALVLGPLLHLPAELVQRWVVSRWPIPVDIQARELELLRMHGLGHVVMMGLFVGILGPVLEEFFFRGTLYGGLRKRYGALVSVSFVASAFAAAHLHPQNMLPLLLVGLILTWLRSTSGSIVPALLAHSAFNLTTIALAAMGRLSLDSSNSLSSSWMLGGTGVAAALVGLIILISRTSAMASLARQEDLI